MDKDELIALLQRLPGGTKVYKRCGASGYDNAWTPAIKVFRTAQGVVAFIDGDWDSAKREHVNYPEKYTGVTDITAEVLGG